MSRGRTPCANSASASWRSPPTPSPGLSRVQGGAFLARAVTRADIRRAYSYLDTATRAARVGSEARLASPAPRSSAGAAPALGVLSPSFVLISHQVLGRRALYPLDHASCPRVSCVAVRGGSPVGKGA